MKLSITQILLGLGIIVAVTLSLAWDSNGFYIRVGEPGSWETIFNPDTKEVIATSLACAVLLLGLIIIGVSIAILISKIRAEYIEFSFEMKNQVKQLVITQMILGLLVTISAFLIVFWGFPTSYSYVLSDNIRQSMFFTPGHQFILAQRLSVITSLLGIVSFCCSISQMRSVRTSGKELVR